MALNEVFSVELPKIVLSPLFVFSKFENPHAVSEVLFVVTVVVPIVIVPVTFLAVEALSSW